MQQTGGTVQVYSEPDQGTTFKLYFPAREDEMEVSAETAFFAETEPVDDVRILVAEDEEQVREVLARTLKRAGYRVIEASSGDEAFSIFCSGSDVDLLLTDIVMPGDLQGTTLAQKLRGDLPGNCLWCSCRVMRTKPRSTGTGCARRMSGL